MTVRKHSISFSDVAYRYAKTLVEAGEYPTVSAAVSGELARAETERARETALLEVELRRRLSLPVDQWEALGDASEITAGARTHLEAATKRS